MKKKTIYKPTYKLTHRSYQHSVRSHGEEIEIIGFYKIDEHVVSNPPNHEETIDQLIETLKGTGISKITITFLDNNL